MNDRPVEAKHAHPDYPIRSSVLAVETKRKAIHLASAAVPVLVWFLPRSISITLLGLAVLLALLVERARVQIRWVRYHFLSRTRHLLRPHERHAIAGATYMAIGYFVVLIALPRPVAVAAMLYNAIGDAAAAIVGLRWGSHRTSWGKSWEGTAACFGVNCGVGLMVPGIPAVAAVLGAAVAAAIELWPIPIDDNLRVTIGGGLALWLFVTLVA